MYRRAGVRTGQLIGREQENGGIANSVSLAGGFAGQIDCPTSSIPRNGLGCRSEGKDVHDREQESVSRLQSHEQDRPYKRREYCEHD